MDTNTTPAPALQETFASFVLTQPNVFTWEADEQLKFTVATAGMDTDTPATTYTLTTDQWTCKEPAEIISLAAKLVELAKSIVP